eukprot:TRINITY_DN781_c0_g3_i2.p1 TRINITY_DN781_c0_g3~~TRINITY_DN781_c0_g3_i2.p1  ORF type:complete len:315 (+),score=60.79 TRINITY_DN781_c0_g3_i2:189-1133(+)
MEQITNIKRNPDDEVAIDTQPYMFPIMTAPTVTMRAIYPGEPIPYYPDPQSDQKKIVPPRVQKACANCKKSHHACDNERPCRRCIDRGTQCFDVESRKRGRKKLGDTVSPPMEPKNTSSPTNQEILSGVENNSSSPEMESLTLMDLPNVGPENVDIFHDLLFSSLLDEDNKVAKKVHTEHGSPGPLMLDFYISAKDMNQVFIQARQKVVESAPEFVPCVLMMEEWLEAVCVRDRIKHHLTRQNIEQQKRIFCETLAVWVDIFGNLGTPMITWERGEVVHFYNDAWKSLTGYSAPTPTKLFSFEIMKVTFNLNST